MRERSFTVDELRVRVFERDEDLARAAADDTAEAIRAAIDARGVANAMFASGNSQLAFLDALAAVAGVDWSRVVGFHMDEYIGLSAEHAASFRHYMRERIVERLHLRAFHYLEGDAVDPEVEGDRYAAILHAHPIDVCCLGIGENGHLAFNDPEVADFDDPVDVKLVELDERCRLQQVGEGHFATIEQVPPRAITLTIPALLRAGTVVAVAPERRKAEPVRRALEGPVSTACPASILRRTPHAVLYLDEGSASLLAAR